MLIFKGKDLIDFSFKLSRIHKAALPNAVRFSLNDAAKDVKFNTLQKHAKKEFKQKKPSFFKAFSGHQLASGYDISKMKSTAGMIKENPKSPLKNKKSRASTDIREQQTAGTIERKSYMFSKESRGSKGLVKKSAITFLNKKPIVSKNKKTFIFYANQANKTKRPLLVKKGRKGILVKVNRVLKRKGFLALTTPIASYEKDRKIKLRTRHPFVNNAAIESGKKLNNFFIKNAKAQLNRFK